MKLKAILFDKDGTFVDFMATWGPAIEGAMRDFAGDDAAAYARLCAVNHFDPVSGQLAATSPFIAEASVDFARRWADALEQPLTPAFQLRLDGLLDAGALQNVAPLGTPHTVFSALKRAGLRLAVVTNDTEAGARAQCAKLGLASHFDAIMGYDSGHGRKPHPGPLLAVGRLFGIAPDEMAMVGDTTHDLHAARAAGALAIAVATGFASADALRPHADHVLPSIDALPALLRDMSDQSNG